MPTTPEPRNLLPGQEAIKAHREQRKAKLDAFFAECERWIAQAEALADAFRLAHRAEPHQAVQDAPRNGDSQRATMSGVQEALGYLTARAAVSARRERALVDHLQAGIALVDGDPRAGEELLAWAMRAQTLIAVTHQAYQRQPTTDGRPLRDADASRLAHRADPQPAVQDAPGTAIPAKTPGYTPDSQRQPVPAPGAGR